MRSVTNLLIIIITIVIIITNCSGILTKPYYNVCYEHDLQILCICTNNQQDLSIATFQMDRFHESVTSIKIENCRNVTIGNGSIETLRNLRQFHINNVENLILDEFSLYWPGYDDDNDNPSIPDLLPSISITFTNTHVEKIRKFALKGKLSEIHFDRVRIERIEPYGVSSISKTIMMEIKNSEIINIQAQAFKKINTNTFIIKNTTFTNSIPSRAFSDLDITDTFQIISSHFLNAIKPQGFFITNPKRTEIYNTDFNLLETECLKITTDGSVAINGNRFGILLPFVFMGFSRKHSTLNPELLLFQNNTFNELKGDTIVFNQTSFSLKYGAININTTCTCEATDLWLQQSYANLIIKDQIHCLYRNQFINVIEFKKNQCYMQHNWLVLIIVICTLFVLMLTAIIAFVFLYRRHKRKRETINKRFNIIVPDGRTYRETELHVIVEKAELLTTDM